MSHSTGHDIKKEIQVADCDVFSRKNLQATLPQLTTRYEVFTKVQRTPTTVASCMPLGGAGPRYLPAKWSSANHPEGSMYFLTEGPFRVVTDAWVYDWGTELKISNWAEFIKGQLPEKFSQSSRLGLYLRLDGEECHYYFVDFNARSVFWLDDVSTSDLGLPDVVSTTHLGLLLEAEFWSHIDQYPMHLGGFSPLEVDELTAVFIHGLGDHMTSEASTFPYDAETCEKTITLLNNSRPLASTGQVISIMARLWQTVVYNRFHTHYGEQQSRLCRDTPILDEHSNQNFRTGVWGAFLSYTTLGAIIGHRHRFDLVMVDSVVYQFDWKKLVNSSMTEWSQTTVVSLLLTMASLISFSVSPSHFVYGSMALSISSFLASVFLHHHVKNLGMSSSAAHTYLCASQSSFVNLDLLALVYASPLGLLHWAGVYFAAHILIIITGLNAFPHFLILLVPLFISSLLLILSFVARLPILSWLRSGRVKLDSAA